MSLNIQKGLLWWSMAFGIIFALAWGFLIGMIPPPPATWSSAEVAAFYSENQTQIVWGAAVCALTSGFWVPLTVVIGMQIARLEDGPPVLAVLQIAAGSVQSLALILPPVFWGIAAFSPDRLADVTAALHQTGTLILVISVQLSIVQWVAWILICFKKTNDPSSPFARWLGYFFIWTTIFFEVGPIAYVTKQGLFAWDGLFVFYIPFGLFFITFCILYPRLFKAIRMQAEDLEHQAATV